MARGHAPKREIKKPKKKGEKRVIGPSPVLASPAVKVVPKRRKTQDEEE